MVRNITVVLRKHSIAFNVLLISFNKIKFCVVIDEFLLFYPSKKSKNVSSTSV